MEKTYISITITYYSSAKNIKPDVHYYRNDGKNVTTSWNKLTVNEANKLMWELIKLGGKNSYQTNMYRNTVCEREVTFWGFL